MAAVILFVNACETPEQRTAASNEAAATDTAINNVDNTANHMIADSNKATMSATDSAATAATSAATPRRRACGGRTPRRPCR